MQQEINNYTTANLSANPNALYVVWAGTNDYLDYFFQNIPNPKNSVANLSAAVTTLAAVGAQDIMVLNLPDLGKFPVTGSDRQTANYLSNLISVHNSGLATSLQNLQQTLNQDINIIAVDVYGLFNQAIANAEEFGFTNVTDSCIGDSPVVPITISAPPVTCDPDQFMFWDEVHPSTTTHKLIGEFAFSALFKTSIPESSPMWGLLIFATGVIFYRQFKRPKNLCWLGVRNYSR